MLRSLITGQGKFMSNTPNQWDHSVDVLVVGSGNGAMTAAISANKMAGKDVLTIEKSAQFGGTSAISGGGVWIPCNRYAQAAGAEDSFDDAKAYLRSVIPEDQVADNLVDSFLRYGPRMIEFLHNNTQHVRYESLEHYPDYYSANDGAKNGHRSMEPAKLNISDLGDEWPDLRHSHHMMWLFDRIAINQVEASVLMTRAKGWVSVMAKMLVKYIIDIPWRLKTKRSREIATGCAGVARLRLAMQDQKLPLWLNTEMQSLISDDTGKVVGAKVLKNGKTMTIQARDGVVLACGGFEHNQSMREQYLPKPTNTAWSAGHKGNVGDGIRAGQTLGAATDMMDGAWWCTTISVPKEPAPRLSIIEKSLPGSVQVNLKGKRIANESQNYMAYLLELFDTHSEENPNVPSYQVFDSRYRNKYIVGPIMGNMQPDWAVPKDYFDGQFFFKADSLEDLAAQTGIDPLGLADTVSKMNDFAITGKDLDLKRGDSVYDRYYGDPEITPNPCLAAIDKPPYYAMVVNPGDFGTHGGLAINEHAQVLRADGSAINGLYACGNCARAILPAYPGPGATLGPAMTFAYQAAKHITGYDDSAQ